MDEEGFGALYQRYRNPFFKIAVGRVGSSAAQDVVHEVFEIVWMKRAEAPQDPEDLARWCFGILRNKVRQEVQRAQRKHHDSRFSADFDFTGSAHVDKGGDVASIIVTKISAQEVWESLSADDRELIVVASAGLPGVEAAALIGITHDAYRRRVSRLRVRIAGHTGDDERVGGGPA